MVFWMIFRTCLIFLMTFLTVFMTFQIGFYNIREGFLAFFVSYLLFWNYYSTLRATPSAAGPFWLLGIAIWGPWGILFDILGAILAPREHLGGSFSHLGSTLGIWFNPRQKGLIPGRRV